MSNQRAIVVYFSISGQTIGPNMTIVNQEKGNTQIVAEYIAEATGADLFRLEMVQSYPEDHMDLIRFAQREQRLGKRPELVGLPTDWDAYDTVYLGYPNWWGSLPMPVVTFLEAMDWSGKTLRPFCTSEGSGLSGTVRQIKRIARKAKVGNALSITGSQAAGSREKVSSWAME
ncbi:MAG: flavodoxin [Tractidigestivibacter sp.]|uniref:flavodoxin n=1 Tax=Tractidigestivibacter sp. TaxID=2847320 RepID=UPI003D8AE3BC